MFLRAFGSSSSSSTSDSSLDPSLPPTGTQYEPYNALLRLTVAFQRFSGGGHGTSVIVSPRVVPVTCLRFLAVNLGRAGFQCHREGGNLGTWQANFDNFEVTVE